jgi:hypothetical protein
VSSPVGRRLSFRGAGEGSGQYIEGAALGVRWAAGGKRCRKGGCTVQKEGFAASGQGCGGQMDWERFWGKRIEESSWWA